MSPRILKSRDAIESCTLQLHSWRPFQLPATMSKTLDSDSPIPYPATTIGFRSKRLCRAGRRTSFSVEALDMSRLSLFDDDSLLSSAACKREGMRWFARKRRRRRRAGSRSLSARTSDRSRSRIHRRRCCSVGASAAYATCSDFPVAAGTDSSGEMFANGHANWSSDVSEAARNPLRERKDNGSDTGEKEHLSSGFGHAENFDQQGNESGYGSEPGYGGDVEFGYCDEVDEEEDDPRLPFWGEQFVGTFSNLERVGENMLQKAHHRCWHKKRDLIMNALM
ncbi:hypothetical protein ACH5RR_020031 [Cinchona calisaya]|uniref:Uncharacterized protein n=1 Tax=Cinchona calisaya TaxID=153742 RepID=A0ABD2ZH45_9GENT